jgi:hypothetical protein
LLRILLISYLCGISSEQKLVEELRHTCCVTGTQISVSTRKSRSLHVFEERPGARSQLNVFEQLFEEVVAPMPVCRCWSPLETPANFSHTPPSYPGVARRSGRCLRRKRRIPGGGSVSGTSLHTINVGVAHGASSRCRNISIN